MKPEYVKGTYWYDYYRTVFTLDKEKEALFVPLDCSMAKPQRQIFIPRQYWYLLIVPGSRTIMRGLHFNSWFHLNQSKLIAFTEKQHFSIILALVWQVISLLHMDCQLQRWEMYWCSWTVWKDINGQECTTRESTKESWISSWNIPNNGYQYQRKEIDSK